MLVRLTHAAIAFAVTTVCYQLYVLTVAPFVEPAHHAHVEHAPIDETLLSTTARRANKYKDLLAAYFPPGHWTLGEPKTLDNGQLLAVLDRYDQTDDARIRVNRCVLVFFPQVRDPAAPPPRDAIIMEAPGGAVLQMNSNEGLSGRGMDDLQHATLVGPIQVRSDMDEPGPHDDLQLATRDLRITKDLIRTNEAVELRLGANFARGRKLEIRFLPKDHTATTQDGPFGGLESLEITHDVFLEIQPEDASLFGQSLAGPIATPPTASPTSPAASNAPDGPSLGDAQGARQSQPTRAAQAQSSPTAASRPEKTGPPPPVRIVSAGPFQFDFANYVASFVDDVHVRQLHGSGELDELQAEELSLFLDPRGPRVNRSTRFDSPIGPTPTGPTPPPRGGAMRLTSLEPASIEAKGNPVRLDVRSREMAARGRRLWLEIPQRRVTVEGADEVRLQYAGNEVHAPLVQYQHPGEESPHLVGNLLAAGGGWLRGRVGRTGDEQLLEVRWAEELKIERRGGQPLLSLVGRPWLSLASEGQMWADRLEVLFIERGDEVAGDPQRSSLPWTFAPQRMAAVGNVAVEASELTARVKRLDIEFEYPASAPKLAATTSTGANSALRARGGRGSGRHYEVTGKRLRLATRILNRQPDVSQIQVDGDVVFQETSTAAASTDPLRITAQQLRVENADTPSAQIEIRGSLQRRSSEQLVSASGSPGVSLAEISAGGTTLRAEVLKLNRGSSEASIDAPGEVQLALRRDLSGQPVENPEPLTITWNKSLRLKEDRIVLTGTVVARHPAGWLQTPTLVAKLTAPIRFDGGAGPRGTAAGQAELEQLECWGGAIAQYDQRDPAGLTARHRVKLESIILNQVTGEVRGRGPGRIESAHLAQSKSPWKTAGEENPSAAQRLRFLGIDFLRELQGNLHRRDLRIDGDVRAVYGPVDAWEQQLSQSPATSPGPDTLWITCDALGVAESPLSVVRSRSSSNSSPRLGPLELTASGKVLIEGQDPQRGAFFARGNRASYDQSKAVFVLEGDGTSPATIAHQKFVGAPISKSSARKLTYHQPSGDIKVEGVNRMELNQINLGRGGAPAQSVER